MKRVFRCVGSLAIIILVLGFYIEIMESVPDRALIIVFPSQKTWIPESDGSFERINALLDDTATRARALAMIKEMTPAKYESVRRGDHKGFRLATGWGSYRDTYVTGFSASVIEYFLARPRSRWGSDGSWNW